MAYKISFTDHSRKQFSKLPKEIQKRIVHYLESKVAKNANLFGKSLTGDKKGLWRYRVGDYRIICNLNNKELIVLVLEIGHRKNVYD
jgi:mRNA interferase RelE/StbE